MKNENKDVLIKALSEAEIILKQMAIDIRVNYTFPKKKGHSTGNFRVVRQKELSPTLHELVVTYEGIASEGGGCNGNKDY